ncbi:MAG: arginine--tRNA ligase [Chitinophagaceae bacterium]
MIISLIREAVLKILQQSNEQSLDDQSFQINITKPEFEGDYTIVLFNLVKKLKKSPDDIGNELGEALLKEYSSFIKTYNIIKGFLNLTIQDQYWLDFLNQNHSDISFGRLKPVSHKIMVEYSSPNTNKPLHLGHLRNNFLGWSIAEILKAEGNQVIKTCIVNDRGIHICKSMIAWKLFSNGDTPNSTGKKGDHFVGEYYVKFNDQYKVEIESLIQKGYTKEEAEKEAPIMKAAQQMLVDWEAGNPDVLKIWKEMNQWVYQGFEDTYKRIGSDFQKIYYESNTYLLGKKLVETGLEKKVFLQKDDGSVWIDLTGEGLDEKIVRRKDGTAVYITQDIGLAVEKYKEFGIDESIYVVGDEQNYHFKVLKLICEKLDLPSSSGIYHLSYGMVELPSGKMKSREGTVVDADDLIDEMVQISEKHTKELGKVKDFTENELIELYETIGLGALKFFLLRVDPKKKMIFNPEESIDFHGFTGPFIQYTHARIRSILRKNTISNKEISKSALLKREKELLLLLEQYPQMITQAAQQHDPSVIAIYVYDLSKCFNSFYAEHSVSNAETEEKKELRLMLCAFTANVIKSSMSLLGIRVPERM